MCIVNSAIVTPHAKSNQVIHLMNPPEPFIVKSSAVLKSLLTIPSKSWQIWCAGGIGIILIIIGFFGDLRFLVLGLMICVAVVPAIVAFLYFSYSLSPQIVPNILPHTVDFLPDGYLIRIWKKEETEDGTEEETEAPQQWIESSTISLSSSDIIAIKSTFEYKILLFSHSSPLHLLFLPHNFTTQQPHNLTTCAS